MVSVRTLPRANSSTSIQEITASFGTSFALNTKGELAIFGAFAGSSVHDPHTIDLGLGLEGGAFDTVEACNQFVVEIKKEDYDDNVWFADLERLSK